MVNTHKFLKKYTPLVVNKNKICYNTAICRTRVGCVKKLTNQTSLCIKKGDTEMHLIQDENGNLLPHSHGHDHGHSHGEGHHHHGAEGCGGKECKESCGQECGHGPEGADKMSALLDYMLKHNEHHAAELDQLAGKLAESGKEAAAEQVRRAVDEYQKGNLYLKLALDLAKES